MSALLQLGSLFCFPARFLLGATRDANLRKLKMRLRMVRVHAKSTVRRHAFNRIKRNPASGNGSRLAGV